MLQSKFVSADRHQKQSAIKPFNEERLKSPEWAETISDKEPEKANFEIDTTLKDREEKSNGEYFDVLEQAHAVRPKGQELDPSKQIINQNEFHLKKG